MGFFDSITKILNPFSGGGDSESKSHAVTTTGDTSQDVNVDVDIDFDLGPVAAAIEHSSSSVALTSALMMEALEEDKQEGREHLGVFAELSQSQYRLVLVGLLGLGGILLLRKR